MIEIVFKRFYADNIQPSSETCRLDVTFSTVFYWHLANYLSIETLSTRVPYTLCGFIKTKLKFLTYALFVDNYLFNIYACKKSEFEEINIMLGIVCQTCMFSGYWSQNNSYSVICPDKINTSWTAVSYSWINKYIRAPSWKMPIICRFLNVPSVMHENITFASVGHLTDILPTM